MSDINILETDRNIDMVFCIDGTGSMTPCISAVKNNARRFYREFVGAMTDMGSKIDSMRIKVIVFRDYKYDEDEAMQESAFFELPADDADFERYMSGIVADGGGDAPENGLEALVCAMRSDFTTGAKDRQVIVLFSDADALDLRERKGCGDYPSDMPDRNGMLEMWSCLKQDKEYKLRERCKRLVMFAPAGTVYEKKICRGFNRSVFVPVQMSRGLGEIDFKDVVRILAASASAAS